MIRGWRLFAALFSSIVDTNTFTISVIFVLIYFLVLVLVLVSFFSFLDTHSSVKLIDKSDAFNY